jgi:hypothetical protein
MPYRRAICRRKFSCSASPNSEIASSKIKSIRTADAPARDIEGNVNGTAVGDKIRGAKAGTADVGIAEESAEGTTCNGANDDGKALGISVGLHTHQKPSTAHPCCAQSYASRLTRACGTYLCVGDRVGSGVVVCDGEGLPVGAGEELAVCTAEGASEGASEGANEGRTVEPHARSIGAIEGI